MPLINHKLRALSRTRAAQWASFAGRSANVPPAFQKRAWAGSLAFSIQSPPRDCLTEGSSRWRTASGVSFASKTRSDAAASCSIRSVSARSQKSLVRSSVAKHAGALALGKSPGLPWDFQRSFALPKQRLQAQEFALERTSPKFHMLVWLGILFCPPRGDSGTRLSGRVQMVSRGSTDDCAGFGPLRPMVHSDVEMDGYTSCTCYPTKTTMLQRFLSKQSTCMVTASHVCSDGSLPICMSLFVVVCCMS